MAMQLMYDLLFKFQLNFKYCKIQMNSYQRNIQFKKCYKLHLIWIMYLQQKCIILKTEINQGI